MKKVFIPLIVIAIILGIVYAMVSKPEKAPPLSDGSSETQIASVTYACAGGKEIQAVYFPSQVHLRLANNVQVNLPQARSASGARYATADESFVFWNKGNTAFVQEKGVDTYTNCAEKDPETVPSTSPESAIVTPLALIEDSRCPINARCIQAGTVRVRVHVSGVKSEEAILTLREPQTVGGKVITLTTVTPEAYAGKTYTFDDYKFTFSVK